jgi:hypothetical protein
MNKTFLIAFSLTTSLSSAYADVEVGPKDAFAAVRTVAFASYEKTKDSLVFTEIKRDMSITCHIAPLDTSQVTGFSFRYRASGTTSKPKAGGEVFYAPIGDGFIDRRKWIIPPLIRDGEWHELTLPLSSIQDIADWRCCGLMTDFRFDPTNADGGRLEISWFRFIMSKRAASPVVSAEQSVGEDVWPNVVPETFKTSAQGRAKHEAVAVAFRGGTVRPVQQTAGGTVRLRYDYRGPVPKTTFIPVTVLLISERSGDVKWSEELSLPLERCIRRMSDDLWALEFDYELPRYIATGAALVGVRSPCLYPSGGHPPYARLDVKRLDVDSDWPDRISAKVVDVCGSPCFAINDKPVYPLWGSVARGRRGLSVRHSSAPLNFVTVSASHLEWWPRGNVSNPVSLDLSAERYRREYPGAYFIWDISIYPPPDWRDANLGEMARDEQGNQNFDDGARINYSFASKKAFDDMENMLRKVIAHLESSPYANRIVGYRINSGHTIEWLGWDPTRQQTILDFSPVAQKGFEAFAKEHYPWVKDYSVPTLAERRALDADGGFLWDQRKHARAIAFHDFYSTAVADGAIRMCRAAKECVGGKKLVGTYYGYVMTLNGGGCNQMRAHYALKHLLDAHAMDFLMSPQNYSNQSRQPGSQICDMKPFRSIQNHGIVSAIEDDTRTHNISPVGHSQTITEEMTINMLRRNMGVSLCRTQPFYTYAITSGYEFDFPQFADDAAVLVAAGRYAIDKGVRRGAQVAVVVSEEAIKSTPMYHGDEAVEYYAGRGLQIYSNTGKVSRHDHVGGTKNASFPYVQFYSETAQIGAGVDFLLAEDLVDNPGDYKLYIFQTCTKLTSALQKAAERLRTRDCTILWTFAPGYTSNDGNSTDNMKALTGMDFTLCPDVTDPGVTLADGTKVGGLTYPNGGRPLAPIFAAAHPDKVLGRYSNGAAGLAECRTGKAKTIFSGSYFMEGPLLRQIAREAGVHIFGDALDIYEANARFLSVHVRSAGKKTIRLPRKTTVVDVFNQEVVARNVDSFTFDAPLHSSWLFCFADDAESLLAGH